MAGLPFDIIDVDSELNEQMKKDFTGERTTFLQAGPKKYLLPSKYREQAAGIYNFKVRSDDVWICTYPRSGTTVMQELLWVLVNDMDFTKAAARPLSERSLFMEDSILMHDELIAEVLSKVKGDPVKEVALHKWCANQVPILDSEESPRVIKTHMPFSLLPPDLVNTSKVVYMARNPKDMATSYYHHNRLIKSIGYVSDFPKYWDYFQKDLVYWSPFFDHVAEAWELREHPNMLFLYYEDLVKDSKALIRQVSTFLGKQYSEQQIDQLANHIKIDNFRKNPTIEGNPTKLPGIRAEGEQNFIRKGEIDSWKAAFSPELSAKADKWIAENIAKIPGLKFPNK